MTMRSGASGADLLAMADQMRKERMESPRGRHDEVCGCAECVNDRVGAALRGESLARRPLTGAELRDVVRLWQRSGVITRAPRRVVLRSDAWGLAALAFVAGWLGHAVWAYMALMDRLGGLR